MANIYRDVTLQNVSENDIGKQMKVSGWVENIRDHGGVSFIDLRDMYGVLQVVIREPELLNRPDRFNYDRFLKLAELFELNIKKPIANFSKGMKRQASIILALSTRAKYMFFDETFDGLDPVMRNLVKKLICNDVAEYDTTVIVTSHSLRELEDICDHLALLHKGGLVLDSDVLELKTTQFKVQIAFKGIFGKTKFEGLNITRYRQEGSVANMIVNGDREETINYLRAMNPVILDVLPLTLEEVFTYEMESLGYEFNDSVEVELN